MRNAILSITPLIVRAGLLALVAALPLSAQDGSHPLNERAPAAPSQDTSEALLPTATGAVFVLRVFYEQDKFYNEKTPAFRVQPGFLIGDGLIGVTNWTALRSFKDTEASFAGIKTRYRLDLIESDHAQDLAVVRLVPIEKPAAGPKGATDRLDQDALAPFTVLKGLPLGSESPPFAPGTWTLSLDPTEMAAQCVSHEVVFSLKPVKPRAAPEKLRAPGGAFGRSLGGLPIVDGQGRLAGAWRWQWVAEDADPLFISAADLGALVSRSSTVTGSSTSAAVPKKFRPVSFTFPVLTLQGGGKASNAKQLCGKLFDNIKCSECNGKGNERTVDERKYDAKNRRWIVTQVPVPCGPCKNTKLGQDNAVWMALRALTAAIASVPTAPDDSEGVLQALENAVQGAAKLNPGLLRDKILTYAKPELSPLTLVPGRAIPFIIPHDEWPSEDLAEWDSPARLIISADYGPLLLTSPVIRNDIADGNDALVMGYVAGFITQGDRNVVVLETPVVVPIEQAAGHR